MSFQIPNLLIAIPEIFILTMACVTLVGELFLGRRLKNIAYYGVQLSLLVAMGLVLFQLGEFRSMTFSGLYVADDISCLLKLFIFIASFFAFYYSKQYVSERELPTGEYYILGLFSILGMMVLVSAHSLLTIYLGLELLSLPLYAMIALRRDSSTATEAAMKYFVMGAIASGMLLYGMSMLFGATASLDLSVIAQHIAKAWPEHSLMISFGLVFIIAGVCFKLAAAPFHQWAPDVYDGSPSSVTLFLSSAPKVAAMGMAMRLLILGLPGTFEQWQPLLIFVALLSTALGNILAVVQTNIKRLLAYSGIAHIGYALFGLIAGTSEGYSAALYYILVYAVMSVGAFGLIVLMSSAGYEACELDDFKGLNARAPWYAFMMLIIMFSMAGVPPMVGFFTKFLVLKALVNVQLTWLALAGLLFAVIGAYYYLRIIKTMYFDAPDQKLGQFKPSASMTVVFSLNALALLALGLFPNALMQACMRAFAFSG